jgi:hypothetical protein
MIIKTNANAPVDPLKLDQTGEFLQTGHRSLDKKPQKESHQLAEWEKLFLKEAFFLYENKGRILSDISMALTPTPFRNGLAYTGSSGLGDATLGVYLEWWDACRKSVVSYDEGIYALTYRIAGSPLSGSNSSSAVTRDGRTITVHLMSPFSDAWGSFMRINQRYAELKNLHLAQAYTLEETIAKLREIHE